MPIFRRENTLFSLHNIPLLGLPLPIPTILNSEDPGKTKACNYRAGISVFIQYIALVFIHKGALCFPVLCMCVCAHVHAHAYMGGSVTTGLGTEQEIWILFFFWIFAVV